MYTRKEPLYRGPISDVYKGEDTKSNVVALKVVDLDFVRKPHDFKQEIHILRRLHHPGVCRYIDNYSLGDDQVLVMEFYGVDMVGVMDHYSRKRTRFNFANPLANQSVRTNGIPPEMLGGTVNALVDALKYIHSQHVIHRDLKPANIMFRSVLDLGRPVIGDFGISYDLDNPKEPSEQKVTDIGTGYYKPPELCFGVSDYGAEVDLWSLGIVISYLYSTDGTPCNFVKPSEGEIDVLPEMNDFVLIQGTFKAFGTPSATDSTSELYWPKLADEKFHFVNFQYEQYKRQENSKLLPRCVDEEVIGVFSRLTRYDKRGF